MNYYFINNDAVSLGGLSRRDGWIRYGLVLTDGSIEYQEQFRQLAPGDIVLIYVNHLGVVAIGSVAGPWNDIADGSSVAGGGSDDNKGHRIRVVWLKDLRDHPLSPEKLQLIIGWAPRQVVQRITKGLELIQGLVADLQRTLGREPPPERMMGASFNAMCERLGCTVEDGHQGLSAESPDRRRIVFSVPAEKVDWTTRTCILLAPAEQQPHESHAVSADIVACAKRAERCVTDPAIEALGVVLRGKPAVTGGPDTGSADTHSVLRLRVQRLAPGHYSAQILTVIFIGVANPDGAA